MIPIRYLSTDPEKKRMLWSSRVEEALRKFDFRLTDSPAEAEALITTWGSPQVDSEMLDSMPRVKIIGHAAGSVRAIAGKTVFERGITLFSANPIMGEAVAEWSLMALLVMQRELTTYAKLRVGEQAAWDKRRPIRDIHDMTIGIWGFGDIARAYLKRLIALEPREILVFSGHAENAEIASFGAVKVNSFDELLRRSDLLNVLTGLTPQNLGMLNAGKLALLPDHAIVINGGRAGLMDYTALEKECRSGRLSAMVDVLPDEPPSGMVPLDELPNVVITPHAAAWSGRTRYLPWVLAQFRRFFDGQPVDGVVTAERFLTMTDETCNRKAVKC